jgi:hypothetical protein
MSLIELLFQISPDGGSGSTELLILAALVSALATAALVRRPFSWR